MTHPMKTVEQAREALEQAVQVALGYGHLDPSQAAAVTAIARAVACEEIAAAEQAEKERRRAFLAGVRSGTVDAFLPMETEGNPVSDETAATPEDAAKGGALYGLGDLLDRLSYSSDTVCRDAHAAISALRSTLAEKDRRIGLARDFASQAQSLLTNPLYPPDMNIDETVRRAKALEVALSDEVKP